MGSGKGSPEFWVAVVKPGRILFEIAGVPEAVAREALRLASHKLPVKTRFVVKGQEEKQFMKKMEEIRQQSSENLLKQVDELKKELFDLRFQQATGNLENPARIREIRKTIARIKTVLTERQNNA